MKKTVLKNFAKLTGNTCSIVSLFMKKEALVQVFFYKFCEDFKNSFFNRASPVAASETGVERVP